MNRWLALLALALCLFAALVVLPRLWRAEPSPPTSTASSRSIGAGARPGSRQGATGDAASRSDIASSRSRADVPGASDRRVGGAPAGRDGGAATDRQDLRVAPQAGDHALPAPRGGSAQATGDETADSGDDIPEVAYKSKPEERFDTGSQAELSDAGPMSGQAGTVAFWLKPEWGASSQDDASFVQFGDSGLQVMKNVNFLRFEYIDPGTGQEYGVGTNIGEWNTGDWRHVTATWTGGNLSLYIDGKLVSQERFPNPPDFQKETRVYVGSAFPNGAAAAPGVMADMTVLNRGTSGAEVTRWYSAGAPR